MICEVLNQVMQGVDLDRSRAYDVMETIMDGHATDAQIAGLLVAMRMKGETPQEVAGCARAMRDHAIKVRANREDVVDTCGTGGDALDTFNISTCAAFVAAGAGVPIAKHGNRSVSSQCGSADVLEALGVNLDLQPHQVAECINTLNIGFLYAPGLHPAMKHAIGPRKELGIRTLFNVLGPLTNPADARRQILGAFSADAAKLMAGALASMGADHALVVHAERGMDEICTRGPTFMLEVRDGQVQQVQWHLEDLQPATDEDIAGGDPAYSADVVRDVLSGQPGPKRDIVIANAAAAIYVGGKAENPRDAISEAKESVHSGAAMEKLQELIATTQEFAEDNNGHTE